MLYFTLLYFTGTAVVRLVACQPLCIEVVENGEELYQYQLNVNKGTAVRG